MRLITNESLRRPEVIRWHERIIQRYVPPEGIALAIILPCSARKPYSKSRSHRKFIKHIKRGAKGKLPLVHEVIMTSPLGIVPRELENVYPAKHYDVPVTGHWTYEEKEIAIRLLKDYIQKANARILAHVDGSYREICDSLHIPLTKENILSAESLNDLESKIKKTLEDFEVSKTIKRRIGDLKRLCDFQFGRGSSEHLISTNIRRKGYQIFSNDKQIASINPQTGYLALSIKGGELLRGFGSYIVSLSFRPETNNIFSIGIRDADPQVRPGDEVIVEYDGKVVGVGKAILNGNEMVRAIKGLAIVLRHRK
ncbi:MAG: DUF5591 domain-containing protein [Candidatus Hydrothermarchaeales archaeon]